MNIFSERMSSLQPSVIREIFKYMADPEVISFAAGNPAPEAFPADIIASITTDIMRNNPITALQYSISEGYPPLREWVKADLTKKGIFAPKDDDVIITSGAQQVMEVMTKLVCNEGETIICEAPSFIGSLNAFRSYKAKLVGVPMDDEGIELARLEAALKANPRTAFIYLIPTFQNPTGRTMTLARRKAVLALAKKYNVLILEDNPYGDLRFAGEDLPTLKELDVQSGERRVVYAGSFSKTLAPGLRVGFMCGAENMVQKATVCIQASTVHTGILSQMITHEFVSRTNFTKHTQKLATLYKAKAKLMLDALQFNMPHSIDFTQPEGGLFIWGTLPENANMVDFCKRAIANKIAVVPGNAFLVDERESCQSFRLNYTFPSDDKIEKGVQILSKVAKEMYK
ncbi:MAG: PLP-dependent aminotransferase family protein [Oscillospiraceae bacterium]|nr:PLP-dependent aminotransferase family protein [Oscillospiraceae bacterium]